MPAHGNLMLGYCGGISLGSWFELERLIKEGVNLEDHPVLKNLVKENIKGLLSLALDQGYQERSDGYVSKCHLCLDIRKHLVSSGDYDELKPREFYKQLR